MVKSTETGASGVYLRSARPDREVPAKDGHLGGKKGLKVGGAAGGQGTVSCSDFCSICIVQKHGIIDGLHRDSRCCSGGHAHNSARKTPRRRISNERYGDARAFAAAEWGANGTGRGYRSPRS